MGRTARRTAERVRWATGDAAWRSHLHAVQPETMESCPLLWEFPKGLARALERNVADPEDRRHMVLFAWNVLTARMEREERRRHPMCSAERMRREVARRVVGIVHAVARHKDGGSGNAWSMRDALPRAPTTDGLRLLARRCARTTESFVEWIHFFQGAVDGGVFAPALPPGSRIPRRPPALPKEPPLVARRRRSTRRPIVAADLERLERAVRSAREGAVLALLRHTGLRREALAGLRIDGVWDAEAGCVRRDGLVAVEKYGETRRIPAPLAGDLTAALDRYLRSLESPLLVPGTELLFPPTPGGRARACPSTVTSTLRRLCLRAGIQPPFRPHQFRTFVVDDAVARGASMQDAARFLGHRSLSVTYRYYFTGGVTRESIPMISAPVAIGVETNDDDEEQKKLDLLETLQRARRLLEGR